VPFFPFVPLARFDSFANPMSAYPLIAEIGADIPNRQRRATTS